MHVGTTTRRPTRAVDRVETFRIKQLLLKYFTLFIATVLKVEL
jgi:hypothetical protein